MSSFSLFIKNLTQRLAEPLPGEEAQLIMAPYQRLLRTSALFNNPNPKPSAVLSLIYPALDKPTTLLMLRNVYKGVHSAQVSFPGGGREEADDSLEQTALRETEEETGVLGRDITIIGKLSPVYIPASGFLVQPYVGYLEKRPVFRPNPKEVSALIETPLHLITEERSIMKKNIQLSNGLIMENTPYFDIQGHTVWGATAMMLGELKMILKEME